MSNTPSVCVCVCVCVCVFVCECERESNGHGVTSAVAPSTAFLPPSRSQRLAVLYHDRQSYLSPPASCQGVPSASSLSSHTTLNAGDACNTSSKTVHQPLAGAALEINRVELVALPRAALERTRDVPLALTPTAGMPPRDRGPIRDPAERDGCSYLSRYL
jgi:hypothetical protein